MIDQKGPGRSCTGCEACKSSCPRKCIKMVYDNEGFRYPHVDSTCNKCGVCIKKCPVLQDCNFGEKLHEPYVFGGFSDDDNIIRKSSSGGIFTVIAEFIINNGGAVSGVCFQENLSLQHVIASDCSQLEHMRGSKYLQSNIDNIYSEIDILLRKNCEVFFVGTPCQVAGLNMFLGKEYENLITCDLICHGVPTQKFFDKYIAYYEKRNSSKARCIKFRDKKRGWKEYFITINFEDGKTESRSVYKDVFMKGFLEDIYLRPACYKCKFVGIPRIGDITLGDFWGIDEIDSILDEDKGVSAIITNSSKGLRVFENIKDNIVYKQYSVEQCIKHNPCLIKSVKMPYLRDEFFRDLDVMSFELIVKKYMPELNIAKRVLRKAKDILSKYLSIGR